MKPTSRSSRSIAIAILVLVVTLGGFAAVVPVLAWQRANAEEIAARTAELATYRRLVAGQDEYERQLVTMSRQSTAANYYVRGDTKAIATANMQKYLTDIATRNGADIISTQIVTTDGEGAGERVSLKVHLQADIRSAMVVLHGLESGRPMLFVDDLVISARPVRGENPNDPPNMKLDLQFELDGFVGSRT